MIQLKGTHGERLELAKKCGFAGVEIDSPGTGNLDELAKASKETGVAVHGVIDSVHWKDTLSSPDEKVRAKGLAALEGALKDAKTVRRDHRSTRSRCREQGRDVRTMLGAARRPK